MEIVFCLKIGSKILLNTWRNASTYITLGSLLSNRLILEEWKMNLHFLNLHLGFVSLQTWVQPSKHVSKAYVTHKPCCPCVRNEESELLSLTCAVWPGTGERPSSCGIRSSVQLAQPPLTALPCETSLQARSKALKPWIHPAWTKTHRAGCMPECRGLWVYCVLAYISRENILHLALDAKLLQLWENSNSPRSKYSFNFLFLEMILRICSEWRQMKNATC